jgi:pimeloyl-ACP methyl ester carboxylesterase
MIVRDEGTGPVLLMLHAFPCDGTLWDPVAGACREAGWRTVVPDLPGFGGSPLLESEPNLDAVADEVMDLLGRLRAPSCAIAGVSLGGYVAMNLVHRYPETVRALLLCDTKATADADPARLNRERLAVICEEAPGDTARILEQAVLPGLLGETTRRHRPDVVDRARRFLMGAQASSVAWYQRAMARRPDSRVALAAWSGPSLVLWGTEDTLSPAEEQEAMLDALHDATAAEVQGAGHLAVIEAPDEAGAAIVQFLDARG